MPTAIPTPTPIPSPIQLAQRYALHAQIAAGGMASVHFGRAFGPMGFARVVAIKRLHPQFAKNPEFVAMFLDEGRLAARIRHPNVLSTLDIVVTDGELFLVMEYVHGESLARLVRGARERNLPPPLRVVGSIMSGVLHGLHAAHEVRNERGEPLGLVHRDVSPQNILVGCDGVARVLDFGVAKAAGRGQTSLSGQLKGKLSYMPPEQFRGASSRQTDVYAAAVVLWEVLTGGRLFKGDNEAVIFSQILHRAIEPPSRFMGKRPVNVSAQMLAALDQVTMRGLDRDPARRYPTAREMALAIERCLGLATPSEVGEWVEAVAQKELRRRVARLNALENSTATDPTDTLETKPIASEFGSQVFIRRSLPGTTKEIITPLTMPVPLRLAPPVRATAPEKPPTDIVLTSPGSGLSQLSPSDAWIGFARPRGRRNAFLVAAAFAAMLVAATALVVLRSSHGGAFPGKVSPAAPASPPARAEAPPSAVHLDKPATPPAVTPSTPSSSTPSSSPASEPSARVPRKPNAPAAPAAMAPTGHKRAPLNRDPAAPGAASPGTAAPASREPSCDPPFVIDDAGRKQYKRECL